MAERLIFNALSERGWLLRLVHGAGEASPLLTAAQEIQLAHRVQKWLLIQRSLEEEKREPEAAEKRAILLGKRAYNRFSIATCAFLASSPTSGKSCNAPQPRRSRPRGLYRPLQGHPEV